MSRPILAASLTAGLAALVPVAATADVPAVVADILPVQGLVARVMDGVGQPGVLIPPGASPHGYALKPSQADALSHARVVFMVGDALTPWLDKPLDSLAPDALRVELLQAPGTTLLPTRTGATFEPHSHAHEGEEGEGHDHHEGEEGEHHDHDGHDHDGHEHGGDAAATGETAAQGGHDHPEGEAHADDDHDHEGHDHEGHDHEGHDHEHGGTDPHAWLDPDNAKAWLTAIAGTLSEIDPEHAAQYRANATAGAGEIDKAAADTQAEVAGLGDARFIVFHDAYQYFEHHFGITAAGSISLSDASTPSPARIAALKAKVAQIGVTCALSEPQFNADLLKVVFEGSNAHTAVIDPLGTTIPEGPQFYPELLRSIGASLQNCR